MNHFNQLISQIEAFIKKFYKNQLIKGILYFAFIFLFSFIIISIVEYFGRFSSFFRTIFFFLFILINGYILFNFIIIPLLKLYKLSKRLSLEEASKMIGNIFPDINDKLLNTLQLQSSIENNSGSLELIKASIEQKSSQLSIIPFSSGINFKSNLKYAKFFGIGLLVFLILSLIQPNIFKDSTQRIVHFNKEYIAPAPFQFILKSSQQFTKGDNYELQIELVGDEIPSELKISSNQGEFNMIKQSKILFTYSFTNLTEDLTFKCIAGDFISDKFVIHSLKKPQVFVHSVDVIYPKHTSLSPDHFTEFSDLNIPEGSIVKWNFNTKDVTNLDVQFLDTTFTYQIHSNPNVTFSKDFNDSTPLKLLYISDKQYIKDSSSIDIQVVNDEYPKITTNVFIDSLNSLNHLVIGDLSDDYGFKSFILKAKLIRNDSIYNFIETLPIKSNQLSQQFSFPVNLSNFNLQRGDELDYWFVVTDNDQINGYKSTSSFKQHYAIPTLDSLDNLLSENNSSIKNQLNKAKEQSDILKSKVSQLKNELINKSTPDWQDKQSLQELLNLNKQLENQIQNLENEIHNQEEENNEFLNQSEELKNKQDELQKLLDQIMDDEMKELLNELEQLMNQMNKEDLINKLEDLDKLNSVDEEELDRTLELFKQIELDQKLENIENQLEEIIKEQKELQNQTEEKSLNPDELKQKQDELNNKFDELIKDMQQADSLNQSLENPKSLDFDKELQENISNEMDSSSDNLDKGKENKASENQKKSSEMMEQLMDDLKSMQSNMQMQQEAEDMDALRFLLENLISLSDQQESLMFKYSVTNTTDPYYVFLNREQLNIINSTEIVKDSLVSLSKRVYQISSFINQELGDLNYNLEQTNIHSEERQVKQTLTYQQYAMTNYNNLALMLSEVLDQMQQNMASKMPGNGSCNKPGGSGQGSGKQPSPSMSDIKQQLQNQLNNLKNGQSPGGKEGNKPGQKDGQGNNPNGGPGTGNVPGMSQEQIAKLVFQQGQLRKALQQMREELNKDGSGNGNLLNEVIQEVEDLENDLLNQKTNFNIYERQQEIMTRLLESEQALNESGFSNERESKEGNNQEKGNLIDFTEYNKQKQSEIELLQSLPLGLRVYYQGLVNEYFNEVKE